MSRQTAADIQRRLNALRESNARSRLNRLQGVPDVAPSVEAMHSRLQYVSWRIVSLLRFCLPHSPHSHQPCAGGTLLTSRGCNSRNLRGPQEPTPSRADIARRMEGLGIAGAAAAYQPSTDMDEEEMIIAQAMELARLERGEPVTAPTSAVPVPPAASSAASSHRGVLTADVSTWNDIANASYEGSDAEIAAVIAAASAAAAAPSAGVPTPNSDGTGSAVSSLHQAGSADGTSDASRFLGGLGLSEADVAVAATAAGSLPDDATITQAKSLVDSFERGGYAAAGKAVVTRTTKHRRRHKARKTRRRQPRRSSGSSTGSSSSSSSSSMYSQSSDEDSF